MGPRPTGTVTFLFTDIEGSTRLWEANPRSMRDTLAEHDALLHAAFRRHHGYVFGIFGDGFGVAFDSPLEALAAALEIQADVGTTPWPHDGDLRVRIAIDTGVAHERDGEYYGTPLNRLGRVIHDIDGGTTAVTKTTADLVASDLPVGVAFHNGRSTRLRDLDGPVTIYEVGPEPSDPPLSTGRKVGLAVAAVAIVALAVGIVAVWLRGTPEPPPPDRLAAASSVATPGTDFLWQARLDPVPKATTIAGGALVGMSGDTGAIALSALDVSSGTSLWERSAGDVFSIHGERQWLAVVSRAGRVNRVDFLDPATGESLSGCGFVLPTAFQRSGEDGFTNFVLHAEPRADVGLTARGTDLFLLTGRSPTGDLSVDTSNLLMRVVVDPREAVCHPEVVVQENVTQWPPILAGPDSTAGGVFVGDAGTVHAFDGETLDRVWSYFPGTGQLSAYDGSTAALSTVDVHVQYAGGVHTETMVYVLDGESRLHGVADGEQRAAVEGEVNAVLATEVGVVLSLPEGTALWSHDLSREIWRRAVPPSLPPVRAGAQLVIVEGATLSIVDLETGETHRSVDLDQAPNSVISGPGVVVVVADDGTASAIAVGETASPAAQPASRPEPPDPITVTHSFYAALDAGDRVALAELMGIDLYIPERSEWNEWGWREFWWSQPETRALFWTRAGLMTAFAVRTEVGGCVSTPRADLDATEVSCEVTQRDAFHDTFGVEFRGTSHVVVRDGLIRMLFAGEHKPRQDEASWTPGTPMGMRVGQFRGVDFGDPTETWFDAAWAWAGRTRSEAFEAACGGLTQETATAECGLFLLEVAPEFAATLP